MSEEEMEVQDTEEVVAETEVAEEMDVISALKIVLKKALIFDGLRRGLHECAKALDRRSARLCILSKDCDNEEYKKLVQALSASGGVPLIMADKGEEIGEWCGLVKLNADGSVKKAVRCSVAVVTDFGEDSTALNFVMNYVNNQNKDE